MGEINLVPVLKRGVQFCKTRYLFTSNFIHKLSHFILYKSTIILLLFVFVWITLKNKNTALNHLDKFSTPVYTITKWIVYQRNEKIISITHALSNITYLRLSQVCLYWTGTSQTESRNSSGNEQTIWYKTLQLLDFN